MGTQALFSTPQVDRENMLQNLTDEQLLERIQHGEAKAFTQLYEQYKTRLYSYCLRLLRNSRAAEDAVQETFVKVHAGCNSVRSFQSLRAWIFTIARNEAFGILRRAKIDLVEEDGQVWETETPLELLIRSEVKDIVQHFLGELKPEYREVLILREYENLSYAELASITSSTESAVKSRLFKARKALVKKLQPFFEERESL